MIELIELQHAVLCAQCERVSASRKTCLGCGSVAILSLARILNRSEEPTPSAIEELLAMVERHMEGVL